jgi:hypothetical protein
MPANVGLTKIFVYLRKYQQPLIFMQRHCGWCDEYSRYPPTNG